MRSTKKLLSLMLALVMLLSVLPTAAFAAENEAEYAFSDSMQAFLSLESIVQLNVGFKLTADGADLSAAEAAALESNVGLLVWKGETAPADAAIETCDVVLGAVYNAAKGRYEVKTDGIPAKELGDALCFMPYYTDGMEYTYGLHYLDPEDGKVYLCFRGGEVGTVTLQYLPHELVGNYFEEV